MSHPTRDRPNAEGDDQISVFISYARSDASFVDRLEAGLTAHGASPLRDLEQIAPLEAWRERLVSLIGQAHSVVFVLSPSWVASAECRRKLDVALEMRKRLAPIVHEELDAASVPSALGLLNWVAFADSDRFDESVLALITALRTDIAWIREQTRLGELARYWSRDGRPEGALLREQALLAAQQLLAQRPAGAPLPSPLLFEYLTEGQRAHDRQEAARRALLDRTLVSQSRALAERSQRLLDRGDAVSAALLAIEALPDRSHEIVRPFVREAALMCETALRLRREWRVLTDAQLHIGDVAFNDDGSRVLALRGSGENRGASVWDADSGALLASLDGEQAIFGGASRLAMRDGKALRVWELADGGASPRLVATMRSASAVSVRKAFSGIQHVFVDHDGLWARIDLDLVDDPLVAPRPSVLKRGSYDTAHLSADGTRIVTTPTFTFAFPTTVEVFDAHTGERIAKLEGHESLVRNAIFSPDGSYVATASSDGTARLWDARRGGVLQVLRGHEDDVSLVRFSADGSMLITGSYDNSFRLWSVSSGQLLAILKGHEGDIPKTTDIYKGFSPRAAFSADNSQTVTTWRDGTARIWRVNPGADLQTVLSGHTAAVNSVVYHPDGRHFVTASEDRTILIWDGDALRPLATLGPFDEAVADLALDASGSRLAGAVGGSIVVWRFETGEELARIDTGESVWSLALSPDGARVGATSLSGKATIWDLATAKVVSRFDEGDSSYGIRFSPSGLLAASCGDERAIRVWNVETASELYAARFQGHSLLGVAFDHRGRRIVAASDDRTARVWTVGSDPAVASVVVMSGHAKGVNTAEFSSGTGERSHGVAGLDRSDLEQHDGRTGRATRRAF